MENKYINLGFRNKSSIVKASPLSITEVVYWYVNHSDLSFSNLIQNVYNLIPVIVIRKVTYYNDILSLFQVLVS